MLDNKTFTEGMIRLESFFRKENASNVFYTDYYRTIKELSNEQFNRAINYLIRNHKSHFFPIPAEFLEAVTFSRESIPTTHQIEPKFIECPKAVKDQIKEVIKRIEERKKK